MTENSRRRALMKSLSLVAAFAGMALATLCDGSAGTAGVPAVPPASQVQPRVPSPPDPTSTYLRQAPSDPLVLPYRTEKHRKHLLPRAERDR
jgi:hypothetical protein